MSHATLNGTFLMAPDPRPIPPRRPRAAAPEADAPGDLLADSLRRKVEHAGPLTPGRRRALVRNHGLALAALGGVPARALAADHHLSLRAVREIVRVACRDAGIGGDDAQG